MRVLRQPGPDLVNQAGELRSARIESLRAVAALSVVVGHVVATDLGGRSAVGDLLERVAFGGTFGVYLFFVLSGYLLYVPFARHAFGHGARPHLPRYAANRALRILPLYYAVLAVCLVVTQDGGTLKQWAVFTTFSENFSTTTVRTVNGAMWSLVVELHFYALLPVLALLLARLARRSPGRALALIALLGLASFALRWFTLYRDPTPSPHLRYSLPSCFMFFAPGMALALLRLMWDGRSPRWLAGRLRLPEVWLVGGVVLWGLVAAGSRLGYLMAPASFLIVGACVLPLRKSPVLSALAWRPLALVGVISYGIYLWHPLIVRELREWTGEPGVVPLLAMALSAVLVVAAASYLLIERPFLRLRRRWGSTALPERERVGA